tara:strand:+ start:1203 stop:1313 length:111 start_codon:yes stop_codon:yes gene_type:complete
MIADTDTDTDTGVLTDISDNRYFIKAKSKIKKENYY